MRIDVVMPKMGESLQEGTITKWLKKVGDRIERDETILEISTDKVDTEVPSPAGGVLVEILYSENTTVEVGKVIAYLETEATFEVKQPVPVVEKVETVQAGKTAPKIEVGSANLVDVVMPKMGESLQEGTIIKWNKQVGEKIERDETILEISTDKVDTEVPAPVGGVLAEILFEANTTIEVGKVIARIATGEIVSKVPVSEPVAQKQEQAVPASTVQAATYNIPRISDGQFFSPLVREIAKAEKVSLEELKTIKGTGIDARITKDDILAYIEKRKSAKPQSSAITVIPESKPVLKLKDPLIQPDASSVSKYGEDVEIIPMDRVRQLIAEHMVFSKRTSAHVTSVAEADVTHIVRYREKNKEIFAKKEGYKLTYTPFFIKAIVDAVKQFPMVNVSVEGKNIIRHKRVNLSFATALEDGNLIVPVIKDADTKNLSGLARAVYDLSTRARTKKLNPDDIQGGTITLTNVGTFGTLFGSPVINQPQTAIVGVGAIQKRPVVREYDGQYMIVIRDMCYVSLTYDHRVIDGMLGGQYLAYIVKLLEQMNETNMNI